MACVNKIWYVEIGIYPIVKRNVVWMILALVWANALWPIISFTWNVRWLLASSHHIISDTNIHLRQIHWIGTIQLRDTQIEKERDIANHCNSLKWIYLMRSRNIFRKIYACIWILGEWKKTQFPYEMLNGLIYSKALVATTF